MVDLSFFFINCRMLREISSYTSKCKNDYFVCLGKKLDHTENFMEWEKGCYNRSRVG